MSKPLVRLEGNTFPVKDELKALGCKWDGDARCWACPEDRLAEANAVIARGAPAGAAPAEKKEFRHHKCKECGAKPSRYVRIYRNGKCGPCIGDDRAERYAD